MISHRYSSLVLSCGLLLSSCGGKGGGGNKSNPPAQPPVPVPGGGGGDGDGDGEAGRETLGLNCHSGKGQALSDDAKFLKDLDTLVFASETEEGKKLARAIAANGWNCK